MANKKIMLMILLATAAENIGDQINDVKIHKMNKHFSNAVVGVVRMTRAWRHQ